MASQVRPQTILKLPAGDIQSECTNGHRIVTALAASRHAMTLDGHPSLAVGPLAPYFVHVDVSRRPRAPRPASLRGARVESRYHGPPRKPSRTRFSSATNSARERRTNRFACVMAPRPQGNPDGLASVSNSPNVRIQGAW